jgi:hypothetical protein
MADARETARAWLAERITPVCAGGDCWPRVVQEIADAILSARRSGGRHRVRRADRRRAQFLVHPHDQAARLRPRVHRGRSPTRSRPDADDFDCGWLSGALPAQPIGETP